jgi:hypothetical protein
MSWGIGDRVGVAVSAGTIATFNSRRPGPVPSLVLDFAGTGTLDSRITFTRSTTGTYYNSSGVLSTAAINAPRFDYNPSTLAPLGLLIEQSSTNLLTYSQDFSNAVWVKTNATVTPNTVVAPDGTNTGSRVTFTTGGILYQIQNTVVSSGSSLTGTIYLKGVAGTTCRFYLQTGGGTYQASVLTVTLTSAWTRVIIPALTLSDAKSNVGVYLDIASSTATYVDIWGAQLEALAFPTSYIPTTSAQVTRASDNASMTGTNFSSWYNQGQGTFYNESDWVQTLTTFPGAYSIDDGTTNNAILSYGANTVLANSRVSGSNIFTSLSATLTSTRTFIKNAIAYSNANYASSFAGAAPTTQASGAVPTGLTRLQIGLYNGGYLNGHIRKFAYYPTNLTSAQLQSLTGS